MLPGFAADERQQEQWVASSGGDGDMERERKREREKGKGERERLSTGKRCEWRPVMTLAKCRPISVGREGEANGEHRRQNKE